MKAKLRYVAVLGAMLFSMIPSQTSASADQPPAPYPSPTPSSTASPTNETQELITREEALVEACYATDSQTVEAPDACEEAANLVIQFADRFKDVSFKRMPDFSKNLAFTIWQLSSRKCESAIDFKDFKNSHAANACYLAFGMLEYRKETPAVFDLLSERCTLFDSPDLCHFEAAVRWQLYRKDPTAEAIAAPAIEAMKKSCARDEGLSCAYAAGMLFGEGKFRDLDAGFALAKQGCVTLKDPQACHELGSAYFFGYATEKDFQKSEAYFGIACAANRKNSCQNLIYVYEHDAVAHVKLSDWPEVSRLFGEACKLESPELFEKIDARQPIDYPGADKACGFFWATAFNPMWL